MHSERHFYTVRWGKRIEIPKVFPHRYIRKKYLLVFLIKKKKKKKIAGGEE